MGNKKKKGSGKSGGNKGSSEGNEAITTRQIVKERERCLCPRLGDGYTRCERAESILKECVIFKIKRTAKKREKILDISRSKLTSFPEEEARSEFLQNGDHLKELNLSRNQLFGSEKLFDSLENLFACLQRLDLSNNYFNGMLSAKIASFGSKLMDTLILDGNQLTELPENICELRHMKHFSIANNSLTKLPSTLGTWRDLQYLNVRGNKLKELPESIFIDPDSPGSPSWTYVEILYLGSNEITKLPNEIHYLTSLTELDLSSNKLSEIPTALSSCSKLRKLHLGNNSISQIPADLFACLTDVEELHLYKNSKLDCIPAEIGALKNCRRLTLSSTNVKSLPESMSEMHNLSELYLNNCAKFSTIPPAAASLTNLQEIQAKKCPLLKSMPNGSWPALKDLDLRAAKKQVCKLSPDLISSLESNQCTIRGGVTKGTKGKVGGSSNCKNKNEMYEK